MNLFRRNLLLSFIAALLCFWLAARTALAQTLTVVLPDNHVVSGRLSDTHGNGNVKGPTEIPKHPLPPKANFHGGKSGGDDDGDIGPGDGPGGPDALVQTGLGPLINGAGVSDFDGLNAYQGGYIPSDSNIAVGPSHIVETVNAAYAVYSKSGSLILGPNSLASLWAGLGGSCNANGGDPVVQYDRAADRWMITQLGALSNPYSECIAISTSNDPTGTYFLYSYSFASNLNDYPKFGVWATATNSAYMASYNLFANGSSFAGPEICAYDRAAMIAGAASPTALCYTGLNGASFLPSDVDGPTPPLDGTPGYFVDLATTGSLGVYALTPNFATKTASLTYTTIPVGASTEANDSPQPGTTETLDALSDRLMYRLAFRVFPDHEGIVVSHAVVAGSSSGVRWYELRAPVSKSGSFSLFQQGTFAPDSNYRWMSSAAMDQSGNIGLGYSVSSGTTFPSVRYTGRVPGDPAGTMESENSIKEGAGSQTGYNRWGDYSAMRIDPSDDCTFWYVNEYLPVSSTYGWYTHMGAFQFFGCGLPPSPDFSVLASPNSVTVTQGNPGSSTVTVNSLNGFNTAVGLAVTGCPANTTCAMNPNSVTPPANSSTTSTLNITTTGTTPTGTVTLTISGTGSSGTHTTTVSLTVNPAAPPADFSLSANPTSVTVTQGSPGSSTITVHSLNGFKTAVGLSVAGCPANTTCAMSPGSVTPPANSTVNSTLNITTTASTPTGTVTLTISGTGSSGTHTTTVSLTVTAGPGDFSLSTNPGSLTVSRKSSGSLTVNTAAVGAGSSVTLSVSGLPSKTTGTFKPSPVAAGSASTLTLSTNPTTKTGTYTVTVTGNNGAHSHSTTFSLTIN